MLLPFLEVKNQYQFGVYFSNTFSIHFIYTGNYQTIQICLVHIVPYLYEVVEYLLIRYLFNDTIYLGCLMRSHIISSHSILLHSIDVMYLALLLLMDILVFKLLDKTQIKKILYYMQCCRRHLCVRFFVCLYVCKSISLGLIASSGLLD